MQPPVARPEPAQEPAAGGLRLPAALRDLRHQRVDVVGIASVEGGAMASYLIRAGFTRVVGHDRQPDLAALERAHDLAHAALPKAERQPRLMRLLDGLQQLQLDQHYLEGVDQSGLVIPTQAWFIAEGNQELHRLRRRGHPFYSLIQAYLELAPGPVVGITGSHGKSTTSSLVAAMARHSQLFPRVWLAGNDRHSRQPLEEMAEAGAEGCLVLEISNRQLLQADRSPEIACITNITENHLDEHQGLEGYIRAKRRIFELGGCRVLVSNGDDPLSQPLSPPKTVERLRFAKASPALLGGDGVFMDAERMILRLEGHPLEGLSRSRVPLIGEHNLANAMAAVAAMGALTRPDQELLDRELEGIERFTGLPHRLQLIWRDEGTDYFDDLSSTTPQSTVAAVRALGRPTVLICGGEDKGIDFGQLAGLVPEPVRRVVLLPGSGSERLARQLVELGQGERLERAPRLDQAVAAASEASRPGDAVLLSPACPGFFTAHYRDGGFRRAVRQITSPRPKMEPG